jgi:ankyrin repeat protein
MTPDQRGAKLLSAATKGKLDVVNQLLSMETNIEFLNKFDKTPLYAAASGGHTPIVELLINKGANKEAAKKDGQTPLYSAASHGHTAVVELLITKGANKEAARIINRETPLYAAASNGHTAVVELLITNGANKEAEKNSRETPLYAAASNGHIDVVKLLINNGANKEAEKNNGQTPLLVAAKNGHKIIVEFLLASGADNNKLNNTGNTASELAAKYGHNDIVRLLSRPIDSISYKLVFVSVDKKYDVTTIADEFDEIVVDSAEKDRRVLFVLTELAVNNLCGGINKKYIEESLPHTSFFVYMLRKTEPLKMEGLVLVIIREDSLHIDVICGSVNYSGVGTLFIDKITKLARNAHKHKVTLSSLTQSVGFYLKKGFECDATCDMRFVLEGGRRSRKRRHYKRKTHKRPKT